MCFVRVYLPQITTCILTLHHHREEWNVFSFSLLSLPLSGSLSVKADSTVRNIQLNEQSSRGSERVQGDSLRFCKVLMHNLDQEGSSLFPQQSQTSAAIIFTTSRERGAPMVSKAPRSLPCSPLLIPLTQPHLTAFSLLLYTLPLLCKDAAQGCNKIHT